MTPALDEQAQDMDIQDAIERGLPPDGVECEVAEHQYTDWRREVSSWKIRIKLPVPWDVGNLIHRIETRVDYVECDSHRPAKTATAYPDGSIGLTVLVGPGVEEDD